MADTTNNGKRPSGSVYPQREKFFACKFVRLLTKTCAAQEIGTTGFTLVTVIAMTEDAAGYRRPVTFWDFQLLPIIGVESQKSLAAARRKVVDAGWLHYEAGCKGRVARYWVTIPDHATGLDDYPSDEGDADSSPMPRKKDDESGNESGTNREQNGNESATKLHGKGQPFLPVPKPIPAPTPKPPLDEWRVVVVGLKDFGLIRAEEAVEEAAANGFTPQQLLDWLAWLNDPTRKGDCGPGTILDRIRTSGAAGWNVDYGWPPPNKAAEAARREQALDQQAKAQRQKAAEDEQKLRRQRADEAALEAAHGAKLDSMTDDELAELVRTDAALKSFLQRFGRTSKLVRPQLLTMFAARDGPPLAVRHPA